MFCVFLTCSWVTADLAAGIFHIYAGNRLCADDGSVFVVEVRSHLLDPYQQHQRGIERFPQIREMMVALESEVQEYAGWGNISCEVDTSPIWLDSTMNYIRGGLNQPQINCG